MSDIPERYTQFLDLEEEFRSPFTIDQRIQMVRGQRCYTNIYDYFDLILIDTDNTPDIDVDAGVDAPPVADVSPDTESTPTQS